jgi:hypothetical protein
MKRSCLTCLLAAAIAVTAPLPLNAAVIVPVSVPDRVRGAERVVVASVASVTASFETNEFGDQIIVSHITLNVQETLKGKKEHTLSLDVEGGTVGGLTLVVSSLPKLSAGERAVFFLEHGRGAAFLPHLRGQGILKLDDVDTVKGSSLTVADIRQMAVAAAGR